MVNNHKKYSSVPDLPNVECRSNEYADCYRVNYGASRGWREFDSEADANQDLVFFIESRVHALSREMFELCRLGRKLSK